MPDEDEIVDAVVVGDGDAEPTGEELVTAPDVGSDLVAPEQIAGGLVTLYGTTEPAEITKAVGAIADELKNVIDKQGLTANIPGRDKPYVEVEGWQVCGTFLGVQPHIVAVEACEPMRGFGVKRKTKKWGPDPSNPKRRVVIEEVEDVWMAKGCSYRVWCEARNLAGGVVGRGLGFCSREESAKIYDDEYSIIGMASTRAISRTLRQSLAFIIAMAGYATTPSEEMEGAGANAGGPPFGPELTDEPMIGKSREALAYLLATGPGPADPDDEAAARVWDEIEKDCSGYMPVRVSRGLLYAAAALKKKVEGGGAEPTPGDPPPTSTDDSSEPGLPEVDQPKED